MIGVPAKELIGVNMRALMALTSDAASYSCPFCRAMADDSDEFVHPVFDRTYLVSTSRVHSASDEGLQTIHVLKDISDRREAERRYRELFDNIQEGLFFSTPGRALYRSQRRHGADAGIREPRRIAADRHSDATLFFPGAARAACRSR